MILLLGYDDVVIAVQTLSKPVAIATTAMSSSREGL